MKTNAIRHMNSTTDGAMRIVEAMRMNPASCHPGDCLIDVSGKMYLIVCVQVEKASVTLTWFRGTRLNSKVYNL